jgi:hypothetical protein
MTLLGNCHQGRSEKAVIGRTERCLYSSRNSQNWTGIAGHYRRSCHLGREPPFHHKDPFDRLLIAQAMVESIPIVSVDAQFDDYPISRLW